MLAHLIFQIFVSADGILGTQLDQARFSMLNSFVIQKLDDYH